MEATTKQRVDWMRAESAYINSVKTLEDLAHEFHCKVKTMEKRAQRFNWVAKRKALNEKASTEAQKSLTFNRIEELARFTTDNLSVVNALNAQIKANLNASALARVALAPDKLRALASTAEVVQRMGRVALGASLDTTPQTDAAETARQVREHTAAMEMATNGTAAALVKP